MHRRALLILAASGAFTLAASSLGTAQAQSSPSELRWTRIPAGDLERYEATIGGLRVNNLALGPEAGIEPAGPATAHEFTFTVANRGSAGQRVMVQLVGQRADGTPTLSTLVEVDVEPRRNETGRERFYASEEEVKQTAAYYLRVLALSHD